MKKYAALLVLCLSIATSALAADVTLSWTAPEDDRVVGYNVYYGPGNPPAANVVDAGSQTEILIQELTEGDVVYFGATSYDADGNESVMSDVLEWTVEPGPKTIRIPAGPREIRLIFEK